MIERPTLQKKYFCKVGFFFLFLKKQKSTKNLYKFIDKLRKCGIIIITEGR